MRALLFSALGLSSVLVVLEACGSSSDATPPAADSGATPPPGTPPGTPPPPPSGSDGAAGTDANDGASSQDASLLAPIFDTLKPNDAGTLSLGWTNQQPDCDGVEAWRKDALHPYVVVFTAPGSATKQDDPGATQNFNYTYKLRCTKGAATSDYSFELSANPKGM